jgi:surfactin synthase thioesterase subunit/uncharacterized protein YbdZ (MbtH family)
MDVDNTGAYCAVRNRLGDYSIWPAGQPLPRGWEAVGAAGSKADALATVRTLWTSLEGVVPQAQSSDEGNPSATAAAQSRWLVRPPTLTKPIRLYVFAHCGGSVGEFLRFRDELPDVELIGVQLPGRGPRLSEPNICELDELVRQIATHVEFEPPFAFFGHSGGALFAFETARALAELGRAEPEALMVSAYPAPHLPLVGVTVHDLPDDVLLAVLSGSFGGVAPEALADNGLADLVLPAFRADFQMCERYRFRHRGVDLTTRLLAIGGDADPVDRHTLGEWHRHTLGDFSVKMFSGGHFYFRDNAKPFLDYVSRELTC